tara:strand:- start:95 stop:475 length:381 start_codon:yes stop_codon:yes gene_type:complete
VVLKGKVVNEDKWAKYFASIRKVCPWSLKAFMKDKILFVETTPVCLDTYAKLFPYTDYEAAVYKWPTASVEWLETLCAGLNEQYDTEWLWSHPDEGGNSTHIPVLIQQDAEKLAELREKIGYVDED